MFNLAQNLTAFYTFFLSFFSSKSRYVGVDIDDTHIRMVEIACQNEIYHIKNYIIIPRIFSHDDFISKISPAFFSEKKLKFITSIADKNVITQKFCLSPKLTEEEMEEYLYMEMEKLTLYSSEELTIDFQVLGPSSTDISLVEVFCAAINRKKIESLNELFNKKFVLHAVYLDSQILSLQNNSNLMNLTYPEKLKHENLAWKKAFELAVHAYLSKTQFIPLFNFSCWRQRKYEKNRKKTIIISVLLIMSSLFSSFLLSNFFEKQLDYKNKEWLYLKNKSQLNLNISNKVFNLQKIIVKRRLMLHHFLINLPKMLPSSMYLTRLEYKQYLKQEALIKVQGFSSSQKYFLVFMKNIQKLKGDSISREYELKDNSYKLQIELNYDENIFKIS